jgi:hypothetical protein
MGAVQLTGCLPFDNFSLSQPFFGAREATSIETQKALVVSISNIFITKLPGTGRGGHSGRSDEPGAGPV